MNSMEHQRIVALMDALVSLAGAVSTALKDLKVATLSPYTEVWRLVNDSIERIDASAEAIDELRRQL